MARYWVSWYSGYYISEGCTKPPFQIWESGYRERNDDTMKTDLTLCAVIDANSEDEIWQVIERHFPDYEYRFCEPRELDYMPGDRFPDFQNRTNLHKIL